jgi:hypothetical protein
VRKLDFYLGGTVTRAHDAAIVLSDKDLTSTLAEALIESVALDIYAELGGQRIPLAYLLNPEHWDEDIRQRIGTEPLDEWLAGLVSDADN